MNTITFISEPSLARKNSRCKNLLLAAVNSHAARFGHRKRHRRELQRKERCQKSRRLRSHGLDRKGNKVLSSQWLNQLLEVRVKYSEYLEESYGGTDEQLINVLFCYFTDVAGPLYVWKSVSTESERCACQDMMMRLFLTEPAFTESMLAWLIGVHPAKQQRNGRYSTRILHHQNKSLSFLREMLGQSEKLHDYSLFWTVVSNIVTNQECGDWASFQTNLAGLKQIIVLLGGWEVLKHRYYRAYSFSKALCHEFTAQNPDCQVKSENSDQTIPFQRHRPVATIHWSPQTSEIPGELMTLYQDGQISYRITACLREAVRLLGQFRQGEDQGAHIEDQKYLMQSDLLELLLNDESMAALEYTLCLGMLVQLTVTPPFRESHQVLHLGQKAFFLTSRFQDMVANVKLETAKGPILWTCLAIMGMFINIGLSVKVRLSLLRPIMLGISNQQPRWSSIRDSLAGIYLDAELERMWSRCWEQVVHS